MRGINFELAMFLAQLSGSDNYSDRRLTAEDLATARNPNDSPAPTGDATVERLLPLRLVLDVNPKESSETKDSTSSKTFRAAVGALWRAALSHLESPTPAQIVEALHKLEQLPGMATQANHEDAANAQSLETSNMIFGIEARIIIPPTATDSTRSAGFSLPLEEESTSTRCLWQSYFGPAAQTDAQQ
jgi:hypothetical protein